jgi:hypothetical protein
VSFLYPRTVRFTRPAAQTGVGKQPYGGQTRAGETAIATAQGLPASIQKRREGIAGSMLPSDAAKPTWYVFIPRGKLAAGVVQDRDVMTDDLGNRFQVIDPYVDSMGANLTVLSLEP